MGGHRASIYSVRVHPRYRVSDHVLFGDWDGGGEWLGDFFMRTLRRLAKVDRNRETEAHFECDLGSGRDVGCTIQTGRGGVTSRLQKPGAPAFLRTPETIENVRTAVLFRLPKGATEGYLASHAAHGHSSKGVVERLLTSACSASGYVLQIQAVIPASALRDAIQRDLIEKVTLIKRRPGDSDEFGDATKWGSEVDRLELDVFARRDRRLMGGPIQRFLENPTDANRRDIIELAGLHFDEAAVKVDLDGVSRTFYIDRPERGFPMSLDLGDPADADELGPDPSDLGQRLRAALNSATGGG